MNKGDILTIFFLLLIIDVGIMIGFSVLYDYFDNRISNIERMVNNTNNSSLIDYVKYNCRDGLMLEYRDYTYKIGIECFKEDN